MEPVGSIVANLGIAPRAPNCWTCKTVASVEDVTVRLIGPEGQDLPYRDAIDYLRGIGHSATQQVWRNRLKHHRNHIRRSLATPIVQTPAGQQVRHLASLEPAGGPSSWLRSPEKAVALGDEAMRLLQDRLGYLEDPDLIAVARLGQAAAGRLGDWAAKGRQLQQVDELMDLTFASNKRDDDGD